jgi:site-specific DNA recombinase
MITLDEFERVQRLVGRQSPAHPKTHEFAFTGMIRCGECGLAVTAGEHVNRFGSHYTYYHCTKRRADYRCPQPCIEVRQLEQQLKQFLSEISISDKLHRWALSKLDKVTQENTATARLARLSLERSIESRAREIDNLVKLRLRDLVSDEEYLAQRKELDLEQRRLSERLTSLKVTECRFEPAKLFVLFSNRAVSWFQEGDLQTKRLIIQITGLNLSLKDRKLSIDARKPFRRWSKKDSFPELLAGVKAVGTLSMQGELIEMMAAIRQIMVLRGEDRDVPRLAA